jgi:hypothetical protein
LDLKEYIYPGDELDLFSSAKNWKKYFSSRLIKYIQGDVLEVGAGSGGTTESLWNDSVKNWLCLEPDKNLFRSLKTKIRTEELPPKTKVLQGGINTVTEGIFDSIAYIDVLEHIENDLDEIRKASHLLSDEGKIIILSPAYNWLYSPFDLSIGHFRRYDFKSLKALESNSLKLIHYEYLDSIGTILNLLNKVLLKSKYPTKRQISFWDNFVVPISKFVDVFLGRKFGKSIIGIYSKR